MKQKGKKGTDRDLDKALAKVASVTFQKLKTDEPLSEKDEEKQAEENQARNIKKEQNTK